MDVGKDFKFVPQPDLAAFTKVPANAPLPSAGIWAPQPHPAPIQQPLEPSPGQPHPGTIAAPSPGARAVAGQPAAGVQSAPDLGLLRDLLGTWKGSGFNVIWRPSNQQGQDHFLEPNLTQESINFEEIPGDIPNRGLLQGDISMRGLHYMQKISDAVTSNALHLEPGIWATVPSTVDPLEPATIVRMASIPHGTSVLAQGVGIAAPGRPNIPNVSIAPFVVATPNVQPPFLETDLKSESPFRSPREQMRGVTQGMIDNPNSLLVEATTNQDIKRTTQINISSGPTPVAGGGVANTAFLLGEGEGRANAKATLVTASFWIETVGGASGEPDFLQLQYSQTVMLEFAGLQWPHVSVATLRKLPAA